MLKSKSYLKYIKFILAVFLFICLANASAYSEQLTGSGCSVSNAGYLRELAKDYEKLTGVKMFVRGGGSIVGIEDLKSHRVDFAASCRHKFADDPDDQNIDYIQVAWDALTFIVHKSNPVENITLDDVRAIYSGKITNWEQLGGGNAPIKIFISKPQMGPGLSGVDTSTREMILNGHEPVKTPNTIFLASSGIVEQMVEDTAEGFATTGFSSARKRKIKMLKVDGIYPEKKNIAKNIYPFKRPLFLLLAKDAKPEARKFVDFALSKKGQELISSYGIVPLMDAK
ncbi:MAG: substrate-binding domain-containing protein [Nitrospirae bacterium]|nr:substrate-binding domain-containing protein [Nitrospirota bacterium]